MSPALLALWVGTARASDPAFDGFDDKSADEKLSVLVVSGKKSYEETCIGCHGADGLGIPGVFPPLAGDPVVVGGNHVAQLRTILAGLQGQPIGGVPYVGVMASWALLTDEQIAAIATYERNAWGNHGGMILPSEVSAVRRAIRP